MAKAFVHIGMPKTGTTAIQRTMAASRGTLSRNGLVYPGDEVDHVLLTAIFHQARDTHWYFRKIKEAPESFLPRAWALVDEITKAHPHDILLSSEYLHNMTPEAVRGLDRFLAEHGFEMVVVCYARHPVDMATSQVQQSVKMGNARLAPLLKDPKWHSIKGTLSPSLKVLGRDKMIVLDFAEAIELGTPRHLLQSIGYKGPLDEIASLRVNESLSMAAVCLADAHTELAEKQPGIAAKRGYLFKIGGPKFRLPAESSTKVREAGRGEVEWLFENFGLRLEERAYSDPAPALIHPEAARDIAAALLRIHPSCSRACA